VELDKEQSVKFIELKTETYQRLIDSLEEIVIKGEVASEDLTRLKFNTHRLAIFASAAVLEEYEHFLEVFRQQIEQDHEVSGRDADILSEALARLTIYIRADLVGELDAESGMSSRQISEQILTNART